MAAYDGSKFCHYEPEDGARCGEPADHHDDEFGVSRCLDHLAESLIIGGVATEEIVTLVGRAALGRTLRRLADEAATKLADVYRFRDALAVVRNAPALSGEEATDATAE